jgi:hypothetical protein
MQKHGLVTVALINGVAPRNSYSIYLTSKSEKIIKDSLKVASYCTVERSYH